MKRHPDVFMDDELIELLADEPELLAIADAIKATQPHSPARGLRAPSARRVALVAACLVTVIVLVASPIGGAIVQAGGEVIGEMSSWVSGSPGEPAGEEAREKFARDIAASLVSFPEGTALRSLIGTEAGDYRFELLGFRSRQSLCLRLVVSDLGPLVPATCALLRQLESGPPVTIMSSNIPVGVQDAPPTDQGYRPPTATATFGFATDGVRAVEIATDDGKGFAEVRSNVFLYVADQPTLRSRVRSVAAIDARGSRTPVPITAATLDRVGLPKISPAEIGGPEKRERVVSGRPIAWLERREGRGDPLPGQLAQELFLQEEGTRLLFGRVLRPDPDSTAAIAVALVDRPGAPGTALARGTFLCAAELRAIRLGGAGCSPADPLQWHQGVFGLGGLSQAFWGDQFASWFGLVSNEVARLQLYPARGEPFAVPLADNAYVLDLHTSAFPAKIVASDADGKVLAVETNPGLTE